jgi:hypothetical protein
MNYRILGNTGLQVSEISFGTIPILQGSIPVLPDYYNLDMEAAIAVMKHAFFLGCNLYDTAIVPEYGDAEIKLGKFAKHIGRERIVISDKARFFTGNEMYQGVLDSCANLGTFADIYFVHQVDRAHEDEVFQKGGALDALTELKREGRIRFAGIASHYYDILLRGAQDRRVDVLQGSGNIFERGMLERIKTEPLFQEKGILVNKVYAAGLLPAFFKENILIQGVLSYPISCALIGLGSIAQVKTAMDWDTRAQLAAIPSFEDVLMILEKHYLPIPCDRCQRCKCLYKEAIAADMDKQMFMESEASVIETEIHTLFRQYQYFYMGKDYWALKKLGLGIAQSAAQCRRCTQMPCLELCPKKYEYQMRYSGLRNWWSGMRFCNGLLKMSIPPLRE